jgi:hypothetical protein
MLIFSQLQIDRPNEKNKDTGNIYEDRNRMRFRLPPSANAKQDATGVTSGKALQAPSRERLLRVRCWTNIPHGLDTPEFHIPEPREYRMLQDGVQLTPFKGQEEVGINAASRWGQLENHIFQMNRGHL